MESPEEKALRLGPVVTRIVHYSSFPELMTCRLVNSLWCHIFSERIRELDVCALRFSFDSNHEKYIRDCKSRKNLDEKKKPSSLQDFLIVLKRKSKNPSFPVVDFCFRGGNLTSPDIQRFFNFHGDKIKTLRILEESGYGKPRLCPTIMTLATIFSSTVTRVKKLELRLLDLDDPTNASLLLDWNRSILLSLPLCEELVCRTVYRGSPHYFPLQNILLGAPNLQIIHNISFLLISDLFNNQLPHVHKSRLVKCLKSLIVNLDMSNNEMINNFLQFSRLSPQLKTLVFPKCIHTWKASPEAGRNFAMAINMLFESSRESLELLKVMLLNILHLPGIRIPQMTNLKSLILHDESVDEGEVGKFFTEDTNYKYSFPALQYFRIFLRHENGENADWSDCPPLPSKFLLNNCWETVTELGLWGDIPPSLVKQLHGMMKGVKKLVIKPYDSEFEKLMKSVWKFFVQVEEIEFQVHDEYLLRNLDSVWTGISREKCEKLRGMDPRMRILLKKFKISKYRLTRLTKLRRLKIIYEGSEHISERGLWDDDLMSELSYEYAFSHMPKLEVTIGYNQHCSTSSFMGEAFAMIAPYVNMIHVA